LSINIKWPATPDSLLCSSLNIPFSYFHLHGKSFDIPITLLLVSGISYSDLIDRLIQLGLQEFERNSKIKYDFRKLGTERVGQKKYNED